VTSWKTKKAHKRLFASSWAMIETNAQLAFTKTNPTKKMTKHEWFLALSESCIHNPFRTARNLGAYSDRPTWQFVQGKSGHVLDVQG